MHHCLSGLRSVCFPFLLYANMLLYRQEEKGKKEGGGGGGEGGRQEVLREKMGEALRRMQIQKVTETRR